MKIAEKQEERIRSVAVRKEETKEEVEEESKMVVSEVILIIFILESLLYIHTNRLEGEHVANRSLSNTVN